MIVNKKYKLNNQNISLSVNQQGEIDSIQYQKQEILHQKEKWWFKTYPMIWPNISFSTGFEVKKQNYELPKHGFWKELTWQTFYEKDKLVQVATHVGNERYPFHIDIQHNISLKANQIIIKTTFTNFGKEKAYFSFGHHPAFKIDDQSVLKQEGKMTMIDLKGKHHDQKQQLKPLNKMVFGKTIDTYVFKNLDTINATLISNNLKINLATSDFKTLFVWQVPGANFICVEPMQGTGDHEYDAPKKAKHKKDIISLNSMQSKSFEFTIAISKAKNN